MTEEEKSIPETRIDLMFPIPVYNTKRDSDLDSSEKKDIEDIIEEGMRFGGGHSFSNNTYIFNTKLKNLKEFCEHHIKNYVRKIINPKEFKINERNKIIINVVLLLKPNLINI